MDSQRKATNIEQGLISYSSDSDQDEFVLLDLPQNQQKQSKLEECVKKIDKILAIAKESSGEHQKYKYLFESKAKSDAANSSTEKIIKNQETIIADKEKLIQLYRKELSEKDKELQTLKDCISKRKTQESQKMEYSEIKKEKCQRSNQMKLKLSNQNRNWYPQSRFIMYNGFDEDRTNKLDIQDNSRMRREDNGTKEKIVQK